MATITNVVCTNNKEIDIQSQGGALNIATSPVATVLTLGNTTGASSVVINTGSVGINIPSFTSYGALVSTSSGVITDTAASTAGFILTSNGTGSIPTFQAASGGGIGTLNGSTGSATGPTVSIVGSNSNIVTSATGSTLTVALANSPSVSGSVTAGTGLIATTGGLTISAGTITLSPFTTTGALVSNASGVITDANASTAGFVLTSNGASSVPTFQAAAAGGIVTISGNSGSITGSTVTLNGGTTGLTTSGSSATMSLTGTLVVANGGTGVTSVTTTPTATHFAGWDANANLNANSLIDGATVYTSGTTVTLTVASTKIQILNFGAGAGTFKLPVTSTLTIGQQYIFISELTPGGYASIVSSGSNLIAYMTSNMGYITVTCMAITGTTAASWSVETGSFIDGVGNVSVGSFAAQYLTSGTSNCMFGENAGQAISTGSNNIAIGKQALSNTLTGSGNVYIGYQTGYNSGSNPTDIIAIGNGAGYNLTPNGSISIGSHSLYANTGSNPNSGVGYYALTSVASGGYNSAFGYNAGSSISSSDSSNIYIGHGVTGTAGDNHVMQIGAGTGTSAGQINNCQISGITGISAASASNIVMVDSGNQLTTASSVQVIYPTTNVTGSTVTLVPGYIYTMNDAVLSTASLPTTASLGTMIYIAGNGAGGWIISQSAGQQINSTAHSTTSGATGTLASGGRYDSVTLCCVVANTTWSIVSSTGTLTFV